MSDSQKILPFQINIPKAELDDLHTRLKRIRWPDQPADTGCAVLERPAGAI